MPLVRERERRRWKEGQKSDLKPIQTEKINLYSFPRALASAKRERERERKENRHLFCKERLYVDPSLCIAGSFAVFTKQEDGRAEEKMAIYVD